MSIQSEINRIKEAKTDIANALNEKGVSTSADAPLATYGDLVRQIPQNGEGGGEAVQEVMLVTAAFSFVNMQATNLSHTYNEILTAVALDKKLVKIAVSYTLPGQTTQNTAIGDLTAVIPSDNAVQFGLFMRANLGTGHALYCFSIYVYATNNIMTNIQLINSTNVG